MENFDIKQFILTMRQIAEEKNLKFESVLEALEHALAAAYRKDYGSRDQNVEVKLSTKTGDFKIFVIKDVVKEVADPELEILLKDAKEIKPNAKVGEQVKIEAKTEGFGRVAAQTAKQVILQKLREAERDVIQEEYSQKIGTILNGTVQRVEPRVVYVDLGRAQGIMPASEQIPGERYSPGQRLKVYLRDVETSARGPQLILSRANSEFVSLLFEREVPEMENNAVEIKAIAREAGVRTKVAVASSVPGVDPVGTFVGGHGTRVQSVINEVGEEKIDIIMYSEDPKELISNALAPTKITKVELDENAKEAKVTVPEDQLSVAIGKNGQNVRVASKLTGWQIDINGSEGTVAETPQEKPARLASKQDLEAALIASVDSKEDAKQEKSQADKEIKDKPQDQAVSVPPKADNTPAQEQDKKPNQSKN